MAAASRSVLALSTIALLVQGGTLMSLPALLPDIAAEFGMVGTAATIMLVVMSAANLLVGWLMGRADARWIVAGGIAMSAAGWLGAAMAQDRAALTAALPMAGVGIAASTIVPGTCVIARDVVQRRGRALALFLGATLLGGTIMPPAMAAIAERLDWRAAMMVQGGAMLAVAPLVLLVRRGVAEMPSQPPAARSLLSGAGRVTVAMTMVQLSINGILFASVDGMMRQGLDHGQAVMAFSIANLMGLPALLAGGWVADRIGGRTAFVYTCTMLAIGSLALLAAGPFGSAGVAAFVLLWGTASALPGQTGAMMIADLVHGDRFPALWGAVVAVAGLAGALAPVLTDMMLAAGAGLAGITLVYAALALGAVGLAVRQGPFTK